MDKIIFIPDSSRGISIPNWLTRVSYSDSLEGEFESLFYSLAKDIFPDYYCLDFKIKIQSEYGNTIPDFALISKDYSKWIIGEIELITHNLSTHVLPQIEKFGSGEYDETLIAEKLCSKFNFLDKEQVRILLNDQTPEIFVIANELRDEWKYPLKLRSAKLFSLEVYSSAHKERIIHFCGESTPSRLKKITRGKPGAPISHMATIYLENALIDKKETDTVTLIVDGALSEWLYVSDNKNACLISTRSFKHTKNDYTLYLNQSNSTLIIL